MEFHLEPMLFQVVVLIILIALMARFVMRPLLAMMKERQDYIDQQITTAEKNRKEAEELAKQQQEALKKARQEAKGKLLNGPRPRRSGSGGDHPPGPGAGGTDDQRSDGANCPGEGKGLAELRDEVGRLSGASCGQGAGEGLDAEEQCPSWSAVVLNR